jgi:hypothetical protein
MSWLLDYYSEWFSGSYRSSRSITSEGSIIWCDKYLSWAGRSHIITNISLSPSILLPYRIYPLWDQTLRVSSSGFLIFSSVRLPIYSSIGLPIFSWVGLPIFSSMPFYRNHILWNRIFSGLKLPYSNIPTQSDSLRDLLVSSIFLVKISNATFNSDFVNPSINWSHSDIHSNIISPLLIWFRIK